MAFFEELTKKAQQVAGAAVEKTKDIAGTVSDKAKAATDATKISLAIASEQRELEKNYKAIGEWFVSEFDGEVPDALKDVLAAVTAAKERIAELEASKVKAEEPAEEEAVEAVVELKTCPNCGASTNSKFCPDCGAAIGE